jgi:hypothetical protein
MTFSKRISKEYLITCNLAILFICFGCQFSAEILRAAEDLKADIITVGSSGMRGINGVFGSISRKILNHSRCSVLIAKS